jgi:hypothetical protein
MFLANSQCTACALLPCHWRPCVKPAAVSAALSRPGREGAHLQQDLGCELAPERRQVALAVCGECAVVVQELRRRAVVPALKLKLCVVIQRIDLVRPNVELLQTGRTIVTRPLVVATI